MRERFQSLFEKIENAPITLGTWLFTFLAIVAIRLMLENFFVHFPFFFLDHYFYFFTDFFFSFLFSLLIIILILRWGGKISFPQAANLGLITLLAIWIPPLIDEIISHGNGLWSFYCFDGLLGLWHRYLHFFGEHPDIGITYGIRMEVALATLFSLGYVLIKTRKFLRSLFTGFLMYSSLFCILALPSFVAIPLLGSEKGFITIGEADIAAFMLTPGPLFGLPAPDVESILNIRVTLLFAPLVVFSTLLIAFFFFRSPFLALLRNVRLPQIIYHLGLFFIGGACVFMNEKPTFGIDIFHFLGIFVLSIAVVSAWIASVVTNDIYDTKIDQITNIDRPLIQNTIPRNTYLTLGWLFFFISLIFSSIISTQLALLLCLYQALAWLYSAPPLRLKRFPGIATALASSASLLVFFGGYIVFSPDKNIAELPWTVPALLFFAYCTLLPIKDFKDIPGDAQDGVLTLPILLGEARAKRFIGAIALLTFILSVFVLNIRHFFPLAFFFGSLAYWVLQISGPEHRYFRYHRLSGWYIALVSSYVVLLGFHFLTR